MKMSLQRLTWQHKSFLLKKSFISTGNPIQLKQAQILGTHLYGLKLSDAT